jgi:hypothetical protein
MKKLLALACSSAMFILSGQAMAMPHGNYQQSCDNCHMKHDSLRCRCRTENGMWQHSQLKNPGSCKRVQNMNGYLTCTNYKKHGDHHKKHLFQVSNGPIWNQGDANNKCPRWCRHSDGKWTGQWVTKNMNRSVCECRKR